MVVNVTQRMEFREIRTLQNSNQDNSLGIRTAPNPRIQVGGKETGQQMQHYTIPGARFAHTFAALAATGWKLTDRRPSASLTPWPSAARRSMSFRCLSMRSFAPAMC